MQISQENITTIMAYVSILSLGVGLMIGEKLGGRDWKRTAKVFGDIGLELGEALNRQNRGNAEAGEADENS